MKAGEHPTRICVGMKLVNTDPDEWWLVTKTYGRTGKPEATLMRDDGELIIERWCWELCEHWTVYEDFDLPEGG